MVGAVSGGLTVPVNAIRDYKLFQNLNFAQVCHSERSEESSNFKD
jgi:hypothetical protein